MEEKKEGTIELPSVAENNSDGSKAGNNDKSASLEADLAKCRQERDEYLDGWKRARADLANYKKEEAARMEQFLKFGQEAYIQELLPVFDSFDLAIEVGRKHGENVRGLEMIFGQLENIMGKFGLERIRAKPGDKFEPMRHEAVAEVESVIPAGDIVEEVASGYQLHDKVIRPVKVNISKGQSATK